jgi:hypothetical protein
MERVEVERVVDEALEKLRVHDLAALGERLDGFEATILRLDQHNREDLQYIRKRLDETLGPQRRRS